MNEETNKFASLQRRYYSPIRPGLNNVLTQVAVILYSSARFFNVIRRRQRSFRSSGRRIK